MWMNINSQSGAKCEIRDFCGRQFDIIYYDYIIFGCWLVANRTTLGVEGQHQTYIKTFQIPFCLVVSFLMLPYLMWDIIFYNLTRRCSGSIGFATMHYLLNIFSSLSISINRHDKRIASSLSTFWRFFP